MKKIIFTSPVNLLFTLFFGLVLNFASAQPTFYVASQNGNYSLIEGDTFSFSVHLNSVSATNTVINIVTVNDTADASDFTPLNTTVTIAAGQLSNSVVMTIPTANDSTIEDNEFFYINGTVTSGNTSNVNLSVPVALIDNDAVPNINIYNSYTITEGSSAGIYYYLSNPYSSDIVINWTTTPGTAGASDFNPFNATLTIPAGQSSGMIGINTLEDTLVEADEDFTLTGTVTSGNTTNVSTTCAITIRDNDTPPTFDLGLNGIAVYEGNNLGFYAYLNRPYNSNVTFQITTATGTAGSADFTATNATYTIAAGTTQVYASIPITDDSLDEPNETFTVNATVTSGNTTNITATSPVVIIDNDGLPDFFISGGDVPFGAPSDVEEGQNAYFRIGLTHPSNSDTVVQISTLNGTASSLDFTPLTLTATIPEGQTYVYLPSFVIPTILDQLLEGDESFNIVGTVTSGNTFNTTDSHTYIIQDNYNLNAQEDTVASVIQVGTTASLIANDTLHGLPVAASDVTFSLNANTIGVTANAQGVITVPATLAEGYYELSYTICEVANPANCDSTSVVLMIKSPIEAVYNVAYSDYNADGYTSVGDIVTFQFDITNNGNAPVTNIDVDTNYGITVLGGPIATLNPGLIDSTTFSAIHIITQDDINFGLNWITSPINQGIQVTFSGTYYGSNTTDWAEPGNTLTLNTPDGIRLKAFVDTNANGLQDGSEINFGLGHFNYQINGSGTTHSLYTTPYYLYESNPATIYNLTYEVDPDYAANNICTVSYPNVTVAPGSGITTYNFPVTVTPYQDLSVSIHNYSAPPRPGFMYYSYISYTNNSNVTVPSGTLTFIKDAAIIMVAMSDNNAVVTSTGFTYNFTNLLPYETRIFWVQMGVANLPTVSLGQLLTNTVSITLPVGDILPLNNTSSLTETIIGSYDPNDKTESHGGRILQSSFSSNDYLTYTIRFENTGTASAINVKVSDVLDDKLDETTIKMIDASHEYALERVNKTLTWNFFGIDLPPSEENSMVGHGYVVFQIKPKPGYAVGDVIPNSANIFFDFNPAIVTDPCITEFVQTMGNEETVFENLEFYPNPTKSQLNLSNSTTIDRVEFTSVLGQKVKSVQVNDLQAQIDLNSLSDGIYFVKVTSAGVEKTIKIIKE